VVSFELDAKERSEEMASMYHSGELAVQGQAGVRESADRIRRSIASTIPLPARNFLRSQPVIVVGSVGQDQRVWASVLTGAPGLAQVLDEHTVRIDARLAAGDPLLANLAANSQVGLLAIEFATRRRMRLNGKAEMGADGAIVVRAQQVYANCPKYIQARRWRTREPQPDSKLLVQRQDILGADQQRSIQEADTFFIATHHPDGGADASHRGGQPGFVRVLNDHRLVWPDYSGNTMFQSLGNIVVNPRAGLLFIDFKTGGTLQLTGRSRILWGPEGAAQFPGAERLVEFDVDEVVEVVWAHSLDWRFLDYSPENPA
jgi:predicted pyridoxine 5'-phosphate oxidase superfamily flavin-nucleotide-binding protein